MKWIEATIYTHHDALEILSAKLMERGIDSFAVNDRADFDAFVENESDKWDLIDEELEQRADVETNVKIYLSDDEEGKEGFRALLDVVDELKALSGIEVGALRVEVSTVDDDAWVNNWKELFSSFEIGERFMIKAPWAEDVETDRQVVIIDPAASFGSGLHESTKLCVEALERTVQKGDIVADVGCGSGILSVIAAKLGAAEVYSTDLDEDAVSAAKNCAALNDVQDRVHVELRDLMERRDQDVIVANIFPDVIIKLAPNAYECLKKGGTFITSGILQQYEDDVKNALQKEGFKDLITYTMNEWVCICAQK